MKGKRLRGRELGYLGGAPFTPRTGADAPTAWTGLFSFFEGQPGASGVEAPEEEKTQNKNSGAISTESSSQFNRAQATGTGRFPAASLWPPIS